LEFASHPKDEEENIMSASLPKLRTLHYLFQERAEGRVVAHCLDLDLVVSAPDLKEAEKRLDSMVVFYVESAYSAGNWDALNTSAPERYWEMFSTGKRIQPQHLKISFTLPEIVPLQSTLSEMPVLAAMANAA
jgi:hypothetical protein